MFCARVFLCRMHSHAELERLCLLAITRMSRRKIVRSTGSETFSQCTEEFTSLHLTLHRETFLTHLPHTPCFIDTTLNLMKCTVIFLKARISFYCLPQCLNVTKSQNMLAESTTLVESLISTHLKFSNSVVIS